MRSDSSSYPDPVERSNIMADEIGSDPPVGELLDGLRNMLRRRFPRAGDDLVNDAAEDCIVDYLRRPSQFDATRGTSVTRFLFPSAARNLSNLMQGEVRRKVREAAFAAQADVSHEDIAPQNKDDERSEIRRRLLSVITDVAERRAVLRWLAGERATAPLANELGLSDRTRSDQQREVKRFKDRVVKRLLRAWPSDQHHTKRA